MKWQTSIGKAFEINKDPGIYGTFAEIGAGQETVNCFYKAGLASQTVAKSMSAYDMTVSDQIYGKQNRYVCKDRLMTMLGHEYSLLEKRLRKNIGHKTRFFAFAVTAVTSNKNRTFANNQHAWMGLRFQAKPREAFNDITFHLNCWDQSRLQQHEALGILGVNLIYACFNRKNNSKQFLTSLTENLSGARVEIHGLSCSGPAFKDFSIPLLNLEILSQNLNSMVYFPSPNYSAFLSDAVFNKSLVIFYEGKNLIKDWLFKKQEFLKKLCLKPKNTACIVYKPSHQIKNLKKQLTELCKNSFSVLVAPLTPLDELRKQLSYYSSKPFVFVVDEAFFINNLFNPHFYKNKSLLSSLGLLFEGKTQLAVIGKSKNFSVSTYKIKNEPANLLKNYLVKKKQIVDLN